MQPANLVTNAPCPEVVAASFVKAATFLIGNITRFSQKGVKSLMSMG